MTGIIGSNEQLSVPANYSAPIPLKPSLGSTPLTRDAALCVAVNGCYAFDEVSNDERIVNRENSRAFGVGGGRF